MNKEAKDGWILKRERAAGDSFDGVRAAGGKGLSALKEKLLGGGGDTKTAAESPP